MVANGSPTADVLVSTALPSALEVPTVGEAGGPALESSTWVLFLAPAGVPRVLRQVKITCRKKSIIKTRYAFLWRGAT